MWQQQLDPVYMERNKKMQLFEKETPIHHKTVKEDIFTSFRPLPGTSKYMNHLIGPHYWQAPYWNNALLEQQILEYKHNFNKPPEEIAHLDIITESKVSEKLRYALIDLWTANPQLTNSSPSPNFSPPNNFTKHQTPVINKAIIPQL